MQSIQFDIEKLGLGPKAVASATGAGAGGFDLILGRAREDLPRPTDRDEPAFERDRYSDRSEHSDRPERPLPREQRPRDVRDSYRDEASDRAPGTGVGERRDPDRTDNTARQNAERIVDDGPGGSPTEQPVETGRVADSQEGKSLDTAPVVGKGQETNDTAARAVAPIVVPVPTPDGTANTAIQPDAAANAASTAATALELAAASPVIQRGPQQDKSAESGRNARNVPASGSNPASAGAQGQDGNGPASAPRQPQSHVTGLEISIQKGPAASGSSTQMSSTTALGVLQEQAASEAQKAEGEARTLLRTADPQKATSATESGGPNGQPGQQGGGLRQQQQPGAGQFLNTPTASGQGGPASGANPGQPVPGTVLPPVTGAEAAASPTSSGQPIHAAAAAGSPTVQMQAAIQAAAPEYLRQGGASQGPAEQVSVQIQTAVKSGTDQISIQLNPADLGKIEVKMELSEDGQLRAVISAEKPETMELLQKDARGLEKSLQDAGLKTDMNSLTFQKGGNGRGPGPEGQSAGRPNGGPTAAPETADPAQSRPSLHDGSLDISV